MEKKEVQEKIITQENNKTSEEEFSNIIKLIAPGTNLRTAIDGALKSQRGALIVVENEQVIPIIDGGFRINTRFTPQKLIELTKMDGAIILSRDTRKINYANVLLTPDSKINSAETGTRHKAAERTAKQAGTLVIAISERKHEIVLFYKNKKYPVSNTADLLRKANEHLQFLEKQRELFDNYIEKLNFLELRNYPSLNQAIQIIQRGYLIQKITNDLKKYITELGKEGMILKVRLKELIKDIEEETDLVVKDYTQFNLKRSKTLIKDLQYDEILDSGHILEILGYDKASPQPITIKGWRILSKTSMHESEIALLVNEANSLGKALNSNLSFYSQIFGYEKAQLIKEEIGKIKLNNFSAQVS